MIYFLLDQFSLTNYSRLPLQEIWMRSRKFEIAFKIKHVLSA